jgi:hypothetical protein
MPSKQRGNYEAPIRHAMNDGINKQLQGKPANVVTGDPKTGPVSQPEPIRPSISARNAESTTPQQGVHHIPPDMHHINAAAGIAHAILGGRKVV